MRDREELPMTASAFTTEDENMRGHEGLSVWRSGITWCREPVEEFDPSVLRHHCLWPLSAVAVAVGSRARKGESVQKGHSAEGPRKIKERGVTMEVRYERCCGIDVHKRSVVAYVIVPGADRQPHKETRTFGTMTAELQGFAAWLQERGGTHVAMESTGVYWQPVFNLLEGANIKLASVATDVMGVSGRAILAEVVKGQADAATMAELAKGRLREKRALLEQALTGVVKAHHRFLLAQHLSHIDYLDEAIAKLDAQVEEQMRPFAVAVARWDTLPGINRRLAQILIAEVGADLRQFPDAAHLASWAGMCPGHQESAGKRHSGKTRKGSVWLRRALTEAAHGAARTKKSYFAAQYHRLAGRRGKKRAVIAVGHSLLVAGYHVITRQEDYTDLGVQYFDQRDREAVRRRSVRRLEQLGFTVTLTPVAAAA